jgi:hypothetical protein
MGAWASGSEALVSCQWLIPFRKFLWHTNGACRLREAVLRECVVSALRDSEPRVRQVTELD